MKSEYIPTMSEYQFRLDGEVVHLSDQWLGDIWSQRVAKRAWRNARDFAEDVAWWKFGYTDDQSTLL